MMSWRTSGAASSSSATAAADAPSSQQQQQHLDGSATTTNDLEDVPSSSSDDQHDTAPTSLAEDLLSSNTTTSKRDPPAQQQQQQQIADDDDDDPETDDDDDDGGDHAEDDDTAAIRWLPQSTHSTCEFTHTILDYSSKREGGCKKAEYSSVTTDNFGNRWRLIVYVNGNGRASNHHLSLFLQVADAEELAFGWKKAVSYTLTLEHPRDAPNKSFAKRNPDKTFKLCPKAIDWGWSQFITSDRIQQEGFVHADTLVVRACVTVKSSSIAIDEDDAELYLKCAVEEGDAASVDLCLAHASVNCQFKDDLYTPLHTACSSSSSTTDVLELLLNKGADGNASNKWKETPLLIAANNGHVAAVEALLKHGANPSLCSEAGWSALTFAAHKGYDDIVALLLRAGAPVNCPVTEDSSTPLHKACAGSKAGHLGAVKLLLGGGANVHALNKWRETPLLTAANHGQAGAVEALLMADADPCKCTDTGWSPLSIAAYKGHDEVVRLLLEEGAPTEEYDPTLSALLQAATKGLPDTVELLLQHGADHTVTTKKGDTALSILVEQNLIDAAVEMVSEYNASIPRCSRDRKKVQRARLLISLRMKQLEREGKEAGSCTEDEESDDSHVAQHLVTEETAVRKKKGGSKSNKKSAEQKAKAAEEALLLELEQEDAQAKRVEAKANSKQAKKKKKKERERKQKQQEELERRQQQERQAEETERAKNEKEAKLRKERAIKEKKDREKEMHEMMAREKAMAAKRKEREEREKRERTQKHQSQRGSGSISPTGSSTSEKLAKAQRSSMKAQTDPTPNRKIASPKGGKKPVVPLGGNRRWETAPKSKSPPNGVQQAASTQSAGIVDPVPKGLGPMSAHHSIATSSTETSSSIASPRLARTKSSESGSNLFVDKSPPVVPSPQAERPVNGTHRYSEGTVEVEHPAIALFRREKVTELLQRCNQALNLVDEQTIKRVLYRWMVRASHGSTAYNDPIIPSWEDTEQLVAYFQRQFIAESRRPSRSGQGPSMESLREAGSWTAMLCQNLAKQVVEFRERIAQQLPPDWTDAALGMTASDGTLNGTGSVVSLSYGSQAQTFLTSLTFATLRDRHVGAPSRFLAAVFVAKMCYETFRLVAADTTMDFRLSPSTQATLSKEVGVTAELWSDPFSALNSNVFWGRFMEVDVLFGGQKPFGKDDHGSEGVLARHGGSLSAMLPVDTMVSSQYVQRMVDLLETASSTGVAVSFAVFLHADCFHDHSNGLHASDLRALDPRLGEQQGAYVSRVEILQSGQHTFHAGEGIGTPSISRQASLFVLLQNEAGRARFGMDDASTSRLLASMSGPQLQKKPTPTTMGRGVSSDFPIGNSAMKAQTGFGYEGIDPVSPDPQRVIAQSEYGTIGGTALSNTTFSPSNDGLSRGPRRGRLFDLVDAGDEEQPLTDDIMSGMLNNLNVDLFQNSTIGSDNVDIEAISLMGIGGPPSRSVSNSGNPHSSGRLR